MPDNHGQMFPVLVGHSAALHEQCYISQELVKSLRVAVNKTF